MSDNPPGDHVLGAEMAGRLEDRVALVFGAGSMKLGAMSNGKAAALTYGREGAKIIAVDIDEEAVRETGEALAAEGIAHIVATADVAIAADVEAAVAAGIAAFGRIDILHNNVGINDFARLTDMTEAQWDRMMNANVKGMFLACRAVLPHMIRQGGGVVTNISALASIRFLGPVIGYMTSKAAVNGFTQSVALEFADQGIRCNAILPGFIDTPAGMHVYEQGDPATRQARKDYRNSKLPGGKAGVPWDIANAALFLASDEARYVNGLLMPVDGGVSLYSPTAK
jgi:NAD(P)-dependent dehydrogenase (short-subunit alcohol dehydrogenase family)